MCDLMWSQVGTPRFLQPALPHMPSYPEEKRLAADGKFPGTSGHRGTGWPGQGARPALSMSLTLLSSPCGPFPVVLPLSPHKPTAPTEQERHPSTGPGLEEIHCHLEIPVNLEQKPI